MLNVSKCSGIESLFSLGTFRYYIEMLNFDQELGNKDI